MRPICNMIDKLEDDSYPTLLLAQALAVGLSRIVTKMKDREISKQAPSETLLKIFNLLETGLSKRLLYKPLEQYDGTINLSSFPSEIIS